MAKTIFMATISVVFLLATSTFADPFTATGNSVVQNSTGNITAIASLTGINSATIQNGAAGNTMSLSGDRVTFTGNNVRQINNGNVRASLTASGINSSTVSNFSAGNAITVN
jgi:hypothetical protein